MADVKISGLPAATTPLAGTELLELVQGGNSVMVAASDVAASASNVRTVATGGTGATTLTGYVKGNGTSAMTAAATIPFADMAGRAYAIFYDSSDQSFTANTPLATNYNVTGLSQGITVANNGSGSPTRVTFASAGTYEINARFQFENTDTTDHDASVWFRLDGADIVFSRSQITVPKATDGGKICLSISGILTVTAAQYVEAIVAVESATVRLDYTAAITSPYTAPSNPSAILVAQRIA